MTTHLKTAARMPFLLLTVAGILLSAGCGAPITTPPGTRTVNFGSILNASGSRALLDLEYGRLTLTDANSVVVLDTPFISNAGDNAMQVELLVGVPYTLNLRLDRRESGTIRSYTWTKEITIPETGSLDLSLSLPAVADWQTFAGAGFTNLFNFGSYMGWTNPPDGTDAFRAALDAYYNRSAGSTSGSGQIINVKWQWKLAGSGPLITLTLDSDFLFDGQHTLKAGSTMQFSPRSSVPCAFDWQFAGGPVERVQGTYRSAGRYIDLANATVNGFDYTDILRQATNVFIPIAQASSTTVEFVFDQYLNLVPVISDTSVLANGLRLNPPPSLNLWAPSGFTYNGAYRPYTSFEWYVNGTLVSSIQNYMQPSITLPGNFVIGTNRITLIVGDVNPPATYHSASFSFTLYP